MRNVLFFAILLFMLGCSRKNHLDLKDYPFQMSQVHQTNDSVMVQWNKTTIPSFKNYLVLKSWNNAEWFILAGFENRDATKFIDDQIAPKTNYYYKVRIVLTNGDTLTSNIQSVKTDSVKLQLFPPEKTAEGVQLRWTSNYLKYIFGRYVIYRKIENQEKAVIGYNNNLENRNYTDISVPYTTNLSYEIALQRQYSTDEARSNEQLYVRKEIKMADTKAYDVQFNANMKAIYFFNSNGNILLFDLDADKITASVNLGTNIGYADFGVYKNSNELYVPTNDGRIVICNAATLAKTDEIQVGASMQTRSVVYNKGLLFASTNAWMNDPLRVYSRAGKNLLSQSGFWYSRRIKIIPGSETELIEVAIEPSGLGLSYMSFDQAGKPVKMIKDVLTDSYSQHGKIFEMFPDGEKFISGEAGNIFNKNLQPEGRLQEINKRFGAFYIDGSSNEIYAVTADRGIEVFSLSTYQHLRTINTTYYPFKVFKSEGHLVVVGTLNKRDNIYMDAEKLFIEIL
ncbi:MAG: hypothetical protein J7539_18085 [Niabella sp.]|nr:hypothetical protein [Niabella sp.]